MAAAPRLAVPLIYEPAAALRAFELGYRKSLDGVRGLAVLAVLGLHAHLPFMAGGAVGVDIFFVLSGFLITSLLLQEWDRTGGINVKRFYARRALRLLPALLLMLCACEVYGVFFLDNVDRGEYQYQIFAALGYFANWVRAFGGEHAMGPLLSHTWSLSIEEQFYLLWPPLLFCLLSLRLRKMQLLLVVSSLFLLTCIHRVLLFEQGASWQRIFNGLDTRVDTLLAGIIAAFLFWTGVIQHERPRRNLTVIAIPAVLLVSATVYWQPTQRCLAVWGWPLLEILVPAVLIALVHSRETAIHRFFERPLLVWIGQVSYSLYIWHYPVFAWTRQLHMARYTTGVLGIALAFVVASLSYYIVERRFLLLKKRFQSP